MIQTNQAMLMGLVRKKAKKIELWKTIGRFVKKQ